MGVEDDLDVDGLLGDISSGLGLGDSDDSLGDTDNNLGDNGGSRDGADSLGGTNSGNPTDPASADPASADPATGEGLQAPKTWRKEAAAIWATLPEAARQEVLKREEDMFKGLEGYKQHALRGRALDQLLEPFLPILQQHNLDPMQQIQGLMNAHYQLATATPEKRAEIFQKLAQDYQVDLGQVAAAQADMAYVDPQVRNLQTQLQGIQSQLKASADAQARQTHEQMLQQVNAFAADPANLYFQDVANDMIPLLEKGICKTLPEAYERALWANPTVRAKELARQQEASAKKAAEEAAAKVAAARKATAANVSARAKSGRPAAPLGSIDDTLAATLREIESRG